MQNPKYIFHKYVRFFNNEGITTVYNSQNRAIVKIPSELLQESILKENILCQQDLETISNLGFFDSSDEINESIKVHYEAENRLIISLETSLSCNLKCPYCYQQKSIRKKENIDKSYLSELIGYIKRVYSISSYNTLYLKILGGEPTLSWHRIDYLIEELSCFCNLQQIKLNLIIETNGTNISDLLNINGNFSTKIIVPLTHKAIHDKYRIFHNKAGSYDLIIRNLNKISELRRDIEIVIRHNTDYDNYIMFEEFVKDLKSKVTFTPKISLHYTFGFNDGYTNRLKHEDYIRWMSDDAISILAENECIILNAPGLYRNKCQHSSKYSIKLFSDGTVGACATSFYLRNNPLITNLVDEIEKNSSCWNGAKHNYLKDKSNCFSCSSFFLCGGYHYLPCGKELNYKECKPDGEMKINLKSFLNTYIKYNELGKGYLFEGFHAK